MKIEKVIVFRFLSFIKFIFTATNQHGVHSPFVYDYVTKCLYSKEKLKLPITSKVLIKSLHYFNSKTVHILGDNKVLEATIKKHCTTVSITETNADVLIGSISYFKNNDIIINSLSDCVMLLLNGIHKNQTSIESWNRLKRESPVCVTIDLFYCGIIFFRKEQVKEHFKIRI
ncbi:hypothetical protein LCGC14_0067740 [marine sediment metagenome]|uniref:Uncharacterized protein n=1 Tax=marine sediment metagenome TaxID=412755 RepID=A0A0F9VQN8_9ZZZZ|nr:hypothetical protein [Maribacter sp.]HDZ05522.1 hypothetical protein [Maribacter sp.]HEA81676.1 hypothetical protein [Maribacter sp.]